MLDVFNMSVGIGIDMRIKTAYQADELSKQGCKGELLTTSCELVVNLLFE